MVYIRNCVQANVVFVCMFLCYTSVAFISGESHKHEYNLSKTLVNIIWQAVDDAWFHAFMYIETVH